MRETIYKGATRPPMLLGVPFIPCILVCGTSALVAMWGGVLVSRWIALGAALTAAAVMLWLRYMSRKDDQRLHQVILQLRLRRKAANGRLWRCRSYSALAWRGKSDAYAR
jgi:type IV secretion system protein VirB3